MLQKLPKITLAMASKLEFVTYAERVHQGALTIPYLLIEVKEVVGLISEEDL